METVDELSKLPKLLMDCVKARSPMTMPDHRRGIETRKIDDTKLANIAKTQAPDKFAGTVRKHEQERPSDDGMLKLEY